MERDFMGLNSKEPLPVVKEEIHDGSSNSGTQWPLLNKVSANTHFMTPKQLAGEDCAKRIGSHPHASSGFMTISAADAFDLSHKRSVVEIQRAFDHSRQVGTHLSMAAYTAQHDAHSTRRTHHDVKMAVSPNQTVATSMTNPLFKAHLVSTGQTMPHGNMKQQLLGGVPLMAQHSIRPTAGSAGVTENWNRFNPNGAPTQMTIFYAGAVNVYDQISPEKAQAIMLLAGNQFTVASNKGQSIAQAQAPSLKAATCDAAVASQPANTPPCSAHSSPISVSSHPVHQSGDGSSGGEELIAASSAGVPATPIVTKPMMPSAVPLARKASLARFLEKRKERAMNIAPYNLNKGAQECGTTSISGGMRLFTADGASSVPFSAGKEISLGH